MSLQRVYPRALKADLAQSKTYSFLAMVCPNGRVTSAHERPTCGDRDNKSVMVVLLRQNGGRGSVWHVVGLKWHPRFSESVGGASPPALLLPATSAGGDVAEQAVQ